MTNEEAINLLDNLVGMVEDNHDAEYDTALCMAIKALEELPKRRKEARRWKAKAAQIRKEITKLPNANPSYWNKCDVVDRQEALAIIDKQTAVGKEQE